MTRGMFVFIILLLVVLYLLPRYPEPRVIPNFLSERERRYIIKQAEPQLKMSTVGRDFKLDNNVRISETAWLDLHDPIVKSVAERCLNLVGKPLENCEKLQVLRYKPGGHYKPHQDAFNDGDTNSRVYTVILALNDEYDGGETIFPNLKKRYKLDAGDALVFHTLDNYGFITKKALHGGSPVKSGEKWICNLWIHKRRFV